MEKKNDSSLLTVIYILTILSTALLIAAIIVLSIGVARKPERGERGETGLSAYDIAVRNGFKGSEELWLNTLVGPQGNQGAQGEKGVGIRSVEQRTDKWGIAHWFVFTMTDGTLSSTEAEPVLLVDPERSYQAETEEERSLLLSYGVEEDRLFSADTADAQIAKGGTLQATADLTISAENGIRRDCRIDLGGHTLTVTGNEALTVAEGTTFTLRHGTLCADADDAIASQRAALSVGKNAVLTLEDVTFEGNSPLVCPMEGSFLTLKGCRIATAGYYAVATNATYGENMRICIEDSTISALRESGEASDGDATAVLVNVPCALSIKGSSLKGSRQGLVVRCGVAELENSTVETTAAFPEHDKYLNESWSQGNEVPCASLVVGNRAYAAYRAPAAVSLKNTTLTARDVPTVYLYGNETQETGASFDYDDASTVGTCEVGGGYVTVNGEKRESVTLPRLLPFPALPFIRRPLHD